MLSLIDVSGGRLAFIFGGVAVVYFLCLGLLDAGFVLVIPFSEARGGRPPPLTSVRE